MRYTHLILGRLFVKVQVRRVVDQETAKGSFRSLSQAATCNYLLFYH